MAVQYTQSRTAKESSMVRRVCPVCKELATIEIAEMSDGWERWLCKRCGCEKQYRVK